MTNTEVIQPRTTKAKGLNLWQLGGLCILGVLGSLNPFTVSICWLIVITYTLYGFVSNKPVIIWYFIAASPFIDLWSRLSRAPFVPTEIGKYYLVMAIVALFVQRVQKQRKPRSLYWTGTAIICLLIPSQIVGLLNFSLDQWIFNVLGMMELGCLLILASTERWDFERFCKTLQIGTFAIIPILVYLVVKTPNLSDVSFTLGANSVAAGGFGSNQVSTIIGLSMANILALIVLKRPFITLVWLNYLLIALLLYRGLLTFSRGGVIGGIVSILIMLLPAMLASWRSFIRYALIGVIMAGISVFIFNKANSLTGNKLLERYEGETMGTLSGDKVKNFNSVTSGRGNIMMADYMIFLNNPLFGVGAGQAKTLREKYGAVLAAAHTEYTRLISEHGIGGLLTDIVLISFPVFWVRKQKMKIWKAVSAAFFFIALFSASHSAMRTNITIVAYTLAAIPIYYIKQNNRNVLS